MKALLLSSAIAAFAAIGSAWAQPMDLPGDQLDQVTAGGGFYGFPFDLSVYKDVYVNQHKHADISANLRSHPDITGNFADSEAAATAFGKGSYTQTMTIGEAVQDVYSRGFSESVAGADGGHHIVNPCKCRW